MRVFHNFWFPFAFVLLLCVGVVGGSMISGSRIGDVGFPAFFCFLPGAFFFIGSSFMDMTGHVRKLEERIKALESKT